MLQAETTVVTGAWVIVLSLNVFLVICLVMAVLMVLFYAWLQVLLDSCDVLFYNCYCCKHQDDGEGMSSWCYIQCEASSCDDSLSMGNGKVHRTNSHNLHLVIDRKQEAEVELISSPKTWQNTILQVVVSALMTTFILLVLLRMKYRSSAFGAANGDLTNMSICGRHCYDKTSVCESESTTLILMPCSGLSGLSRESFVPASEPNHSKRKTTQNHDPQIPSALLKFLLLNFIRRAPEYAQFVRSTIRNQFLVLCYEFFSVAYGNVIPMIKYTAEQVIRRYNRDIEETIEIRLRGGPNHGYCAMLSIGALDQIQQFCVLIDTGSSNLAIAASSHPDVQDFFDINRVSSSYEDLNTEVSVSYTEGEWSGRLVQDTVSIGSSQQEHSIQAFVALIQSSRNFFISDASWEGILGLAYPSLAKPDSGVEPYWDTLRKTEGMRDVFAVQLCPPLDASNSSTGLDQGGKLVFGGEHGDDPLHEGTIFYTSIIKENFYNVLISSISVEGIQVDISCSKFNCGGTIVDSGTTDIYLPTESFVAVRTSFLEFFKNSTKLDIPSSFWNGESKLAWSSSNLHFFFSNFPTVYIGFASHQSEDQEFALAVTPQIYLRQVEGSRHEQTNSNCHPTCDFFVFGLKQRNEGAIIGGNVFLGFTTIFDREQGRIGFAKSTCQYQDHDEGTVPHIVGPYRREAKSCICNTLPTTIIYAFSVVIVAVATLLVLVSVILTVKLHRIKSSPTASPSQSYCSCLKKKVYSVEEDSEITELTHDRDELINEDDVRGSNRPHRQYFEALTGIAKKAGASFLDYLKSKVYRKDKFTNLPVIFDSNLSEIRFEDLELDNSTNSFGESDTNTSFEQDGDTNSGNETSQNLEIEMARSGELVAGEINSAASFHRDQHEELVTGKSSYIDENYGVPKLALSDSPMSSLTSTLGAMLPTEFNIRQNSNDCSEVCDDDTTTTSEMGVSGDVGGETNDLSSEATPANDTVEPNTIMNTIEMNTDDSIYKSRQFVFIGAQEHPYSPTATASSASERPSSESERPSSESESDQEKQLLKKPVPQASLKADNDARQQGSRENHHTTSQSTKKPKKQCGTSRRNRKKKSKARSENKTAGLTANTELATLRNNHHPKQELLSNQQIALQQNMMNNYTSHNAGDSNTNLSLKSANVSD